MADNINSNWKKWTDSIGEKLIKDVQISIGNEIHYDSTKDEYKEEKIKLINH